MMLHFDVGRNTHVNGVSQAKPRGSRAGVTQEMPRRSTQQATLHDAVGSLLSKLHDKHEW